MSQGQMALGFNKVLGECGSSFFRIVVKDEQGNAGK